MTTTRIASVLAALGLVLGLLAAAPAASAHHESPYDPSETVTVCLDGPNEWEQMYEVDCSVRAEVESDNLCHNFGREVVCDGPTGVDSNTTCLYQFNSTTRADGLVVDEYEIGACLVRGDQKDPSDLCVYHVQFVDGTHYWMWNDCPNDLYGDPIVPVSLTLSE